MNATMEAQTPRLFTFEEAGKVLGCSHWKLRRHADGAIRVTRLGRLVRISSEEIDRIRKEGLPSLK